MPEGKERTIRELNKRHADQLLTTSVHNPPFPSSSLSLRFFLEENFPLSSFLATFECNPVSVKNVCNVCVSTADHFPRGIFHVCSDIFRQLLERRPR